MFQSQQVLVSRILNFEWKRMFDSKKQTIYRSCCCNGSDRSRAQVGLNCSVLEGVYLKKLKFCCPSIYLPFHMNFVDSNEESSTTWQVRFAKLKPPKNTKLSLGILHHLLSCK